MNRPDGSGRSAVTIAVSLAIVSVAAIVIVVANSAVPVQASALAGARGPGIELIDDLGRVQRLPEPPRRIVSLAPHATELLFAAGAGGQVVGVDPDSDHPPAVIELPKVGALPEPSIERLLALAPDLVVAWAPAVRPGFVERMAALGVPVHVSDPRTLDAVAATLEQFAGLAADSTDRASGLAMASGFRTHLATLRQRWADRVEVKVFVQVWADPLITLSNRDLVGDQLALCRAVNIAGDLPGAAPMLDPERVLAASPDLVLATDHPGSADAWKRLGLLAPSGPARFVYLDARVLQRPGPRVLDAVDTLCELIDSARQAGLRRLPSPGSRTPVRSSTPAIPLDR